MYEMDQPTVKEEKELWCEIIENIKTENDNSYEPVFVETSGIEPKPELLDGDWTETCGHPYDACIDVCKEELHESLKSEIICEKIVGTFHPVTDLSSKQLPAEPIGNEELSECANSKSSNYSGYSMRHVNLNPSPKYDLKSADCNQTSGSLAEISMIANTNQGNTTSSELGDNTNLISPLTLTETHDNINTNNKTNNNLEGKIDLKTQTASLLKRKKSYRDSNYENIESISKSANFFATNKIKMTTKNKNGGEKCFLCTLCSYKCGHKSSLASHMRTHTGEKPFSCTFCTYKCNHKSTLINHIRTHTSEKRFSCSLCSYKCDRNCHFVHHMRTHTGEKPFSCNLCNYKSGHKNHLVSHMKNHTGEKPFSCKICNYKCVSKSYLLSHMRTHTVEKPFSCKLCDYKSVRKTCLVSHMRTHTGEKPFSCTLCTYKCSHRISLVNHIRTHTGEKPFSCDHCTFKCSLKVKLIPHMKIHTGGKPCSCSLCKYNNSNKSTLVNQMRTNTNDKPS